MPLKLSSPGTGGFWELPILFEDEHLLALDKPAGLLSASESSDSAHPNLVDLLHQSIAAGKPWAAERDISFLMPAYRLDPEASGILLLARSKPVLNRLSDLFGSHQPALSIITLAEGSPSQSHFSVEAKLMPHPDRPGLMCVSAKHGKRSRTDFQVMEHYTGWTLLKCVPFTHRPHQVRVHSARAGLPLAGDQAYGGRPLLLSRLKPGFRVKPNHTERPLINSPCVHVEQLTLDHPATGNRLVIEAPWPKALAVAVKYLRKYATV